MELALLLLKGQPVTVWDIASQIEDYDHAAKPATLYKSVERDVRDLADLGIVVRPSATDDRKQRRWQIDEASSCVGAAFSQEAELYARLLGQILATQLNDDSLMYREQLRGAIVKLVGSLDARLHARSPQTAKLTPIQRKLIEAPGRHSVLELEYADAQGHKSTRRVECYGTYLLRGHVYLVAHTLGTQCVPNGNTSTKEQVDSQIIDDGMRRYRDDRLLATPRERGTFVPQEDFDIARWVLLPFQIGLTQGSVQFRVPAARVDDVKRSLRPQDALEAAGDASGDYELRVDGYAQADIAARWALAEGIEPVAPADVRASWCELLAEARAAAYLDEANEQAPVPRAKAQSPAVRRGRPASGGTSAQLFRLYAMFAHAGSVRVDDVASTLGVSEERAEELLTTLMSTIVDTGYLPLWYDEQSASYQFVAGDRSVSTRLRLTPAEARAVEEALEKAQLAQELGPELNVVRQAFWPLEAVAAAPAEHPADLTRQVQERPALERPAPQPAPEPLLETLEVLSRALREQRQLNFAYRGLKDATAQQRTVLPLNIFSRDGYFYLSALDMDRQAVRQFRTDRMAQVSSCALSAHKRELVRKLSRRLDHTWLDEAPRVTLCFDDPSWAELFDWEGMDALVKRSDGRWCATIPDLGGSWLPRHLVACVPHVCTTDRALAERSLGYAQSL